MQWHYPSGALYAHFEENRRTYFYESGETKTIEEYRAGLLHGVVSLYWPNGRLKRRSFFSFGKRHGSDQMWDQEGTLKDESFYEIGEPTGLHRRWNRRGNLKEESIFFEKGKCNFKRYDEEGSLIEEGIWGTSGYVERKWNREKECFEERFS